MEANNMKAMRDALEEILEKIDKWRTDGTMEHWQYSQLFDIADAALEKPPRNCDAFSKAEVLEELEDRSFSKEDTIDWLYEEAKGATK